MCRTWADDITEVTIEDEIVYVTLHSRDVFHAYSMRMRDMDSFVARYLEQRSARDGRPANVVAFPLPPIAHADTA